MARRPVAVAAAFQTSAVTQPSALHLSANAAEPDHRGCGLSDSRAADSRCLIELQPPAQRERVLRQQQHQLPQWKRQLRRPADSSPDTHTDTVTLPSSANQDDCTTSWIPEFQWSPKSYASNVNKIIANDDSLTVSIVADAKLA